MNTRLREAIEIWLERKGNSLLRLAKKSGVSYTTVRRVIQGEQEPSVRTSVAIASVVCTTTEQAREALKDLPGSTLHFAGEVGNGEHLREELLSNSISHAVISLAVTGTTREVVQKELGRRGIEVLETLIEKNMIEEKSGKLWAEDFDVTALADVIRAIQLSAAEVGTDNAIGTGWWVEGWSRAGIIKIAGLISEFNNQIQKMRINADYRGEICATLGLFFFRRGGKGK